MKKDTPRNLALSVLRGVESRRAAFSDRLLDEAFRGCPGLDRRDRAFVSHLVQGVLRWKIRLDWILEQYSRFPLKRITPDVLNILRLALYQIMFMDRVPDSAAVNRAVEQSRRFARPHVVSYVNGVLRSICRKGPESACPERGSGLVRFLSVCYSYPPWLVEKWLEELGEGQTESLLAAGNQLPKPVIRANLLKTDRPGLVRRLKAEGVIAEPTERSPEGLRIEGLRGSVAELRAFHEGLFTVQDEAAQIVSHILHPFSGQRILDVCAGFGGKATHLAELMKDQGMVLALDIKHHRLVNLSRTVERLGLRCVVPVTADAARGLSYLIRPAFERILVDAPCSGLGVISRHPDLKWNRDKDDPVRLAEIQKSILRQAVSVLKDNGLLLYVTCTISKVENEQVVQELLQTREDLHLEDIGGHIPAWGKDMVDAQGFFKSFPNLHHMDGFFAALLKKKEVRMPPARPV